MNFIEGNCGVFENKSGSFVKTVRAIAATKVRGVLLPEIGLIATYKKWGIDRQFLKEGKTVAYVVNRDDPFCSECGLIGIEPTTGKGLVRTW